MPRAEPDAHTVLDATLAQPSSDAARPPETGELVAGFRIEGQLGEGTFGWVFQATSDRGERVAVKVLRPEHAASDSIVRRFTRRELELLLRIQDTSPTPHVVRAVERNVLVQRGLLCLVLEYVEGPTLAAVLAREKMLDAEDVRRIGRGIALGLAHIHDAEGIHRDLKPENVRLRDGTEPVILDLGIAKAEWATQTLTAAGKSPMTPLYASPEQLEGVEVTVATDVYSLGLILYEMLVGAVPLAGRTQAETRAARIGRTAPDPRSMGRAIPEALARLVLECLERDPTKRPTASAVANRLAGSRGPSRRRRWGMYVGVAVSAVLAGAGLAAVRHTLHPGSGAPPERTPLAGPERTAPPVQPAQSTDRHTPAAQGPASGGPPPEPGVALPTAPATQPPRPAPTGHLARPTGAPTSSEAAELGQLRVSAWENTDVTVQPTGVTMAARFPRPGNHAVAVFTLAPGEYRVQCALPGSGEIIHTRANVDAGHTTHVDCLR